MNKSKLKKSILHALEKYDHFIIAGHQEPDGDCLCSQMALSSFLKRMHKETTLVSAGPFNRPEIKDWEKYFSQSISDCQIDEKTLCVIVDCSTVERTGSLANQIKNLPLLVIDHHSSGEISGEYNYIDPSSPSTTLLIQHIIESSGEEPTKEEADLIFLGFCTDTGFFRHLDSGNPEIFKSITRLVEAGVSPNLTHRLITGGRTHGSRRLLGRILDRSKLYFHGKLIISWEKLSDRAELQANDRDSDSMYQMLQSIGGIEAVAIIREENNNACSIGLRSNNLVDVGKIAQTHGGGGHKKASGCSINGDLDEVQKKLLTSFENAF